MKLLVAVSGAKTSCNQAVNPAARGEVIGTCDVDATGCEDSILTESDKGVPVNIKPLPTDCKILSSGCLFSKPTPCAPVVTTDWNNTSSGFGDTDENVLTENSFIMCNVGGQIDIEDPNQSEITVGTPLSEIFSDGIVTMEEAEALFKYLAEQEDIAFAFPIDGCYARAHLMVQKMKELGIPEDSIGKVWTFATDKSLRVDTNHDPNGYVTWGWHVAPTLEVTDENGNIVEMTIDPSIESGPVTNDEWVATSANGGNPHVVTTELGEPPIPEYGGSGYRPTQDPPEGVDEHAEATMEDYLIRQEDSENSYEGGN